MMLKHLPNLLSILRMVLVPFYLVSLYLVGDNIGLILALVIFVVAGLTDWLDGHLARKLDCVTDFGKIIDPLADKLIVSVALISLILEPINLISHLPVILILFREFTVTLLRKHYSRKQIIISANYWGKVKTTLQMIGIIATLVYAVAREYLVFLEHYELHIQAGIRIFFWVIVVITMVSGLSYLLPVSGNRKKPETGQ